MNIGGDDWGDILNGYSSLYNKHRFEYASFINELAATVAKYHMVVHCFNDALYLYDANAPLFNRAMVVHYWSKGAAAWGSVEKFKTMGHDIINTSQAIYWVAGNGPKVTEAGMRAFDVKKFYGNDIVSWTPQGACFCIWIGTRESPALDDDGAAITTAVLPLIQVFGETIINQL